MQKWEYLFVVANYEYGNWRAKYANGNEILGWERITLYDYANQIGDEGWELVAAPFAVNTSPNARTETTFRLIFKRPKDG